MNLLLVDSSTIFRMGLRAALAATPEAADLQVVAECGEGGQARELALALVPDVVVTDLNLPDLNGIALTRELARAVPSAKVLLLAAHSPVAIVHQAIGAALAATRSRLSPRRRSWPRSGRSGGASWCCRPGSPCRRRGPPDGASETAPPTPSSACRSASARSSIW